MEEMSQSILLQQCALVTTVLSLSYYCLISISIIIIDIDIVIAIAITITMANIRPIFKRSTRRRPGCSLPKAVFLQTDS